MIIIDPYMLAIPIGSDVDEEAAREYAQRLRKWEKEFSREKQYIVSDWASQVIYKLCLAPTRSNLKALFDRFNITEYSPQDIVPTASGVLANAPRVEEVSGLYDSDIWLEMEYIKDTEVVIPEEIRARLHPQVAEEFVESLIYAGYACKARQDITMWSIATAPFEREKKATDEMYLECTIEKLSTESTVERGKFSQEWPLLFDPQHLYATYDVMDFYQSDLRMATQITWCKMKADGARLHGIDVAQFRFGSKFLNSLEQPRIRRRPHFKRDIERVFEAIVFVLEDLWTYGSDKHHPLREIITSRTSPQQTRQRVDISGKQHREKAARVEVRAGDNCLHLHYWQCFDGSYEFSNVTDAHNDPTIYSV